MPGIHSHLSQCLISLKMHLSSLREVKSFRHSLEHPKEIQETVLRRILSTNKNSSFGKLHKFSSITTEREYRDRVPIHTYEELRPYIEEQIGGKDSGWPMKPSLCLQTSGTTGKPKYIPVYQNTLKSYRRCQSISSYAQYKAISGIFSGRFLAVVSPKVEGYLEDGVPYGSMSGAIAQSLSKAISSRGVLPQAIFEVADYEDRYRLIAALAISDPEISSLASANPSTFLRLSGVIEQQIESLLSYMETGDASMLGLKMPQGDSSILLSHHKPNGARAAELRHLIREHGRLTFSQLWPKLRAVATWTSGNCALCIPVLEKLLSSGVRIIDMGYMASEFWGTINMDPIHNAGCLTIQDNFYEFIEPHLWDGGSCETTLTSEIEEGKQYYIIATTPDGLYRYFINDIIEVTGSYLNSPTIRFVQKGKGVTSLSGEKLYEGQVIQAVQEVSRNLNIEADLFVMLADRQQFSYVLYVESKVDFDPLIFSANLRNQLGKLNIEFDSKLKSGRIKGAEVRRVKEGTFEAHKKAALISGQREGQFKTIRLQYRDETAFPFHEYE